MRMNSTLAALHRINEVCLRFEETWIQRHEADVASFLADCSGEDRRKLLEELLRLDIHYRRQRGDTVAPESYYARFPGDQSTIDAAFQPTQDADDGVDYEAPTQSIGCAEAAELPAVLAPGTRIDRFSVGHLLGRGSFGDVYLARDHRDNLPVALKLLHPRPGDPQRVERAIAEEVRLAKRLSHPGIARVHESGTTDDGRVFIVSEYINGRSLDTMMQDNDWHWVEGVEILIRVADAVSHVHQQGLFHRDLKPANIVVGPEGHPRVVDFGLALDEEVQWQRMGEFVGTLFYMSPEQILGEIGLLDGRTDIWALGAILYEILTGVRPYDGESRSQVIYQILHGSPKPPRQKQLKHISRELERICLKALARHAEDRYTTAGDMADELRAALVELREQAEAARQRREYLEGRPARALAERARYWAEKPHWTRLPHPVTFARAWLFTDHTKWMATEIAVMKKARPVFAASCLIAAILMIAVALGIVGTTRQFHHQQVERQVERRVDTLVREISSATPEAFPALAAELANYDEQAERALRDELARSRQAGDDAAALRCSLALLPDRQQLEDICRRIVTADDDTLPDLRRLVLDRDVLLPYRDDAIALFLDELTQSRVLTPGAERLLAEAPTDVVDRLIEADGFLDGEFALCQTLPAEQFDALQTAMAEAGYHIVRQRPYRVGERGLVAAIWWRGFTPPSLAGFAPPDDPLAPSTVDATADGFGFARIDEVDPEYFGDLPGLVDVLVTDSPRKESREQRFRRQLDLARQFQATPSSSLAASLIEGRAQYCLGEFHDAVTRLTTVVDESPAYRFFALSLRPLAYARIGQEPQAHEDLARFAAQFNSDDPTLRTAFLTYLHAQILAYSNDLASAEELLEKAIDDAQGYAEMHFYAACAYAAIADSLVDDDALRQAFLARSVTQLQAARATGLERWSRRILTTADLEPVRQLPTFNELLPSTSTTPHYSGYWIVDSQPSTLLGSIASPRHVKKYRTLIAKGKEPVAIAGIAVDDEPHIASVWRTGTWSSDDSQRVDRQANAAVAMLHLEADESLWRLLEAHPRPSLRTRLIHRLASLGLDPRHLLARLRSTSIPSLQRAIILALGEYTEQQLPQIVRSEAIALTTDLRNTTADAGVHSSATWLLRRWQSEGLETVGEDADLDSSAPRSWYLAADGQQMVVIPAPGTIVTGSPETEPLRSHNELQSTALIDYDFAICVTEVTVGQFHEYVRGSLSLARNADWDAPARVTWAQAAAYCNRLSAIEGIPDDQWCYTVIERDGQTVSASAEANFLQRTGYRLPTEAEWEFACRSGTQDPTYAGWQTEMLDSYAWHLGNSDGAPHAVGLLKPNEFGLFDMLGNVAEWCHDPWLDVARDESLQAPAGTPTAGPLWPTRGGSYRVDPRQVRSAARFPLTNRQLAGFRIAQTRAIGQTRILRPNCGIEARSDMVTRVTTAPP